MDGAIVEIYVAAPHLIALCLSLQYGPITCPLIFSPGLYPDHIAIVKKNNQIRSYLKNK